MPRNRSRRGSGRRSRRHGPAISTIALGSAAALATIGALGYGAVAYGGPALTQAMTAHSDSVSPTPVPTSLEVVRTIVAGLILDPSGSNGGARQASTSLDVLADSLEGWAGPKPTAEHGSPSVPGLDLTVRRVARNSFAANGQVAHVVIPGIPAVLERPADPGDTDAGIAFLASHTAATKAWQAATDTAHEYAQRLRTMTVRGEVSEVAGSVSALTQVLPSSEEPRPIIVISDVEQAGAQPQITGDLANTVISVFQRCDRGVQRCEAAKESFSELVSALNGPAPTFKRIETLRSSLTSALKGQ